MGSRRKTPAAMSVRRSAGVDMRQMIGALLQEIFRFTMILSKHRDLTGICNLLRFYTLSSSNLATVILLLHFHHQLISLTGLEGKKNPKTSLAADESRQRQMRTTFCWKATINRDGNLNLFCCSKELHQAAQPGQSSAE